MSSDDIRSSFLYVSSVLASNILPVVTLPIFSRLLTPQDYGLLALATVYSAFTVGLANAGLGQGYERQSFEAAYVRSGGGLLYSVLLFVGTTLLVLGSVTWFFKDPLSRWVIRQEGRGALLVVTFCSVAVQGLRQYVLTYYRNRLDARSYVVASLAEAVSWTALSLLFVGALGIGVIGLPLGQLVGSSLVLAVMLGRLLVRMRPSFDRRALAGALEVGLPLTPRVLLSTIGNHFDKYLVGLLSTVGSVGIYSIGQRISYTVFSYMTALENAFGPRVYRLMFESGQESGRKVGEYLTPFAYVSAGVALGVALFGEEVLFLLTPPEYHAAAPVVSLLALYYASMFFAKQKELTFARRTALIPLLAAATVALNVLFNVPFIRAWGAPGAAAGTLIAGVLSVWLTVAVSRRYYRIGYEVRKLAAIFGLLTLATGVVLLFRGLGVPYPVRALAKAGTVGAFLILGQRLGILSRASLSSFKRALTARSVEPEATGAGD